MVTAAGMAYSSVAASIIVAPAACQGPVVPLAQDLRPRRLPSDHGPRRLHQLLQAAVKSREELCRQLGGRSFCVARSCWAFRARGAGVAESGEALGSVFQSRDGRG